MFIFLFFFLYLFHFSLFISLYVISFCEYFCFQLSFLNCAAKILQKNGSCKRALGGKMVTGR